MIHYDACIFRWTWKIYAWMNLWLHFWLKSWLAGVLGFLYQGYPLLAACNGFGGISWSHGWLCRPGWVLWGAGHDVEVPKFGCKTYNISQDSSMLIAEFQQKPTANLYDMCDAYRLWDVTFAPSASTIARGVTIRDIASKLQLMTRIRCPFARKVISKVIDTWFPNAGVCVCVFLVSGRWKHPAADH